MSQPEPGPALETHEVSVNGLPCRVWKKGSGRPIVYLAGVGGLPRWTQFLECLSRHRRVVAPSMPGHPGSLGHDRLDGQLDWVIAVRELLEAAGGIGADLVGSSVGGALAAEMAALWPESVHHLVLVAPLGIYEPAEPVADLWAQKPNALSSLLCRHPERFEALWSVPEEADPVEWQIAQVRASTADACLLWPMCDTGLAKRLHRVRAPTLLVWGAGDRVLPMSYAQRFARAINGPSREVVLPEAGHLVELDQPAALCREVLSFCEGGEQ